MGRRKSEVPSAEDTILKEISSAYNGITLRELENKTLLHRSTISTITRDLLNKRKIKNEGTKKRPKYFPVRISLKHSDVYTERFAEEAKRVFLSHITMMSVIEDIYDETGKNLLHNNSRFFQTKFSHDSNREERIFELVNRLGALIIYVIIQGIRRLSTLSDERDLSIQEKDEIIREEIDVALSNILTPHVMLSTFRSWFPDFNKHEKNKGRLFYEYDKKTIEELLQAFSRLYPSLNSQLDEIRNNLFPNIIDVKNRIESNLEHSGCKGKLLPPEIENGLAMIKCSKCDFVDIVPTT